MVRSIRLVACEYSREFGAKEALRDMRVLIPGGSAQRVMEEDFTLWVCETREEGSSLVMDCSSGFGAATFVTGVFGFVAAGEVVRRIAAGSGDAAFEGGRRG
jgi:hypothetical protein